VLRAADVCPAICLFACLHQRTPRPAFCSRTRVRAAWAPTAEERAAGAPARVDRPNERAFTPAVATTATVRGRRHAVRAAAGSGWRDAGRRRRRLVANGVLTLLKQELQTGWLLLLHFLPSSSRRRCCVSLALADVPSSAATMFSRQHADAAFQGPPAAAERTYLSHFLSGDERFHAYNLRR